MKTSVNMIRHLDQYDIVQRTKDGYFDANYFLSQWNAVDSNPRRRMDEFLKSPKTKEFINEIVNNEKSQTSKVMDGDFKSVIITKGKNTTNFLADLKSV